MKIPITKDWCLNMAKQEDDAEISAGGIAKCEWEYGHSLNGGCGRCGGTWSTPGNVQRPDTCTFNESDN